MGLTWRVDVGGSKTTVAFEGEIVESADLHSLQGKLVGDLEMDLGGVRRVNSAGAHRWVEFLRSLPSAARIAFVNCSPAVVTQINLIHDFIGRGTVRSFYAPYSCERCETHYSELMQTREVRKADWSAPKIECPGCHQTMELDDDPDRYFAFARA